MNFNSLEEHGYLGYLTSSFIDKNINTFANRWRSELKKNL